MLFVTHTRMPAALPASMPMRVSSMTTHRAGSTPSVFAARLYTSGAGFFFSTTSPAKTWILSANSGSILSRMPVTAFSFEVEQMATCAPLSSASFTRRATPGRNGSSPASTTSRNSSVLRRCSDLIHALRSSLSSGYIDLNGSTSAQELK